MALADTARLVASLELEDKFSRGAASAEASLGRLTSKTSTLGRVAGETQRGLGNLAGNLRTIGTIAVGAAATGLVFSIKAASSLEESMSKVNVVFAEGADEVIAWSETSANAFGQSQQQALEAAGTFGNLFQAFGVARPEAQQMSQDLVELAADLASFNNTSVEEAIDALRSGLSGETEPLKRYGAAISDVRIRQEAMRRGLIKSTKDALTPAIKAQAIYSLVLQDTALAQGDFARTSDGLANQQRILEANLRDTAATIGTAVLPIVTDLVSKLNTLFIENRPAIEAAAAELPKVFDAIVEIGGNLPWTAIGDAFRLMGAGSKALLDAFVGLPPWVQTAVLTGWGLNKLTGGALTGIVSELGKGLIKGVLGINAGVVNLRAGAVTGGGVAGGAAATGGLTIGSFLGLATASALGFIIGSNIGKVLTDPVIAPAREFEGQAFDDAMNRGELRQTIETLDSKLDSFSDPALGFPVLVDHITSLVSGQDSQLTILENQLATAKSLFTASELQRQSQRENSIADLNDRRQANQFLANIAAKPPPYTSVNVAVHTAVSVSNVQRTIVSQQISAGARGGFTVE